MIFLISNYALSVPHLSKPLPDPVVPVLSPPQCAIGVVVLPEPVGSAVVPVGSPLDCAIGVVPLTDTVASAFCIVLIFCF